MKIWAVVPVKPFIRAKSRLTNVLSVAQRGALAESMFRHGVETLMKVKKIGGVTVLSRDTKVLAIARDYGLRTIQESGAPNLNISLQRAAEILYQVGWGGVLILPADLPLVAPEDIEQMIYLGRYLMTAVIAPDRQGSDTNALLVKPANLIPFSFGTDSVQRHITLAEKAGATVQIYRSERIALDIDTPTDLELYRQQIGPKIYGNDAGGTAPFDVVLDAIYHGTPDIDEGCSEDAVRRDPLRTQDSAAPMH